MGFGLFAALGRRLSGRRSGQATPPADTTIMDQLKAQLAAVGAELAAARAQLGGLDAIQRIGFLEDQGKGLDYERVTNYWRAYVLERELFGSPNPTPKPPREIPPELTDRFTMNGLATIEYIYRDLTYPDNYPLIYTDAEIDDYIARIKSGKTFIYGTLDTWVNEALKKYSVKGATVVNMGSRSPWYEAMILLNGGRPVTIDYNRIVAKTDRIKTLTVAE